ncbi:MMPL family transporter [Streptomyces zagrosensis]|uniref:RND superfamily putative drug exporter n=1 Tax=Streptomyces zagrosensis TaxID=1042984 RepID=A0A7W9Q426_9ACTN|nr:MMPL family transporter [Streptomyces zagrosensis]MBB5933229.1 RND superfamily putative drug exporter [Streptomyces zagrosensis]
MFAGLGRFVVRRPWWVIVTWVIAAAAVISLAPKLTATSDEASFLPSSYESIRAMDLQEAKFPQQQNIGAIIVFQRSDGARLTSADSADVRKISAALAKKKIPEVQDVEAASASPNKRVQTAIIAMPKTTNPDDTSQQDAAQTLRDKLPAELDGTDLTAGVTGSAAQGLDERESSERAGTLVAVGTVVIIVVLLLLIFRSPIIALLPVVLIGLISPMTTGLIASANEIFDMKADRSIQELLTVVLFGVGTDYILFLLFRYREALRAGEDAKGGMVHAVERVGEAIASAAGAVIVAFAALALSTLGMLKSMGPALAIAVFVTLLAGLTLVPAVVSLLGTRVFWPSRSWQAEPTGAGFARFGRVLARRPAVWALLSAVFMGALAVGALGYRANFDLAGSSLPKSKESMVAQRDMEKGFPAGTTDPTSVYLDSTGDRRLSRADTAAFRTKLRAVDGVGSVDAALLSKDRRTAAYEVVLTDPPASDDALDTVKKGVRPAADEAAPHGARALVGGSTAVYVDINKAVDRDYAVVFPVAALCIMVILGLLLRSLVAPWYLMISVALGFGATLGATSLLFQQIGSQPGLMFMLPVIMYLFVVALGTDYNILMVSRLREEAREGRDPRDAAGTAVRHSGPTIAAAGVILAGTFATLMLAGNATLSQMGFALSFGIAVAAFVMAMIFTPSLTALIGHTAWWPGHGDEHPRQGGRTAQTAQAAQTGRGSAAHSPTEPPPDEPQR